MMSFFRRLLHGVSLDDRLNETKVIRIDGVKFRLRKINVLNYLDGSNIIQQYFETYESAKKEKSEKLPDKKLKEYLSQVLVAGIESPKLSFNDDKSGTFVDRLFVDMSMVWKLYSEIMLFTYGKKKVIINHSQPHA